MPGEKQGSVVVRLQGVSNLIRASLQVCLDAFTADVENASPNPRLAFRQVDWKWSLPGLVIVALLAAFFNPPDPGVTSGEFEYVQSVVDGNTLVLGTGERVGLIGVNTPETVSPQEGCRGIRQGGLRFH